MKAMLGPTAFTRAVLIFWGETMSNRFTKLCLAAALCLPLPAAAQDASFQLELNAAETLENDACRLYFLTTNGSASALEQVEYEFAFLFNEDTGVPPAILRVKFGAFPSGKTRLSAIPIDKAACDGISRIVINDTSACTEADSGADTDICMSALNATSRTAIQFGI